MLKALMLQKKRTAKNAELKTLRAKRKTLGETEAKLKRDVEGADTITDELEQAVQENTDAITEVDDQIAAVLDELDGMPVRI